MVVELWWSCGGGVVVVKLWWWSCGGGVVVELWWSCGRVVVKKDVVKKDAVNCVEKDVVKVVKRGGVDG